MSVYDIVNDISSVTKVFKRKLYRPDDVVALFYINDVEIKMYFRDYNKRLLKDQLSMIKYTKKIVMLDFWDPRFCAADNISDYDIQNVKKSFKINYSEDYRSVVTGFIITLIGVYKLIYNSYTIRDFKNSIKDINFDKNIFSEVLCQVDIVIDYNQNMIDLLRSTLSEYVMPKFLVTPSGSFRLIRKNIVPLLEDTKILHEISTAMFNTIDHSELIDYYIELLKTPNVIYSPKMITSYETEHILLNVLKLDVDLELKENDILRFLNSYIDKGGSLDIDFQLEYNKKYGNALPLLNTFIEYHLS